MSEKIVIEGIPELRYEDGGCACILTLYNEQGNNFLNPFVRIQTYDVSLEPDHSAVQSLVGQKLRVTIEIMNDQ